VTHADTIEIYIGGSSKVKNRNIIRFCCIIPDMYSKESKSAYSRNSHTPMFIRALFTVAKLLNQSRHPPTNEENVVYIYNGVLLRLQKSIIYKKVGGTGHYHFKKNKPDSER
jgi:hypothetical protein